MKNKRRERFRYIPLRYILAVMLTVIEIIAIIAVVVGLCALSGVFYFAAGLIHVACVISIINSDYNPDYKVPWLFFVLVLPIVGFMLYFLFYSRKLKKKYVKRYKDMRHIKYNYSDSALKEELEKEDKLALMHAKMLTRIADTSIFGAEDIKYYPDAGKMFDDMLSDLKGASSFIFMEYFIIDKGELFDKILEVLKEKAKEGVDVRIVYDDIGCMRTLPGRYYKQLLRMGIKAVPFSKLRGSADSEFNNRSHRKITVIDGIIGYTGGANIADEYVNLKNRFGHWKDTGIRLKGCAVYELTRIFVTDYGINCKEKPAFDLELYPPSCFERSHGYVIPFGDGPAPLDGHAVGKTVIQNMLESATRYVYITTPYLIIDNELCSSIERAAQRGVEVKIIIPRVPDKKIVYGITKTFCQRLKRAGVEIFEYVSGFIHAKTYVCDDKCAMVGTINLDYRSLAHHFECGVFMYRTDAILRIKEDVENTLLLCEPMEKIKHRNLVSAILVVVAKIFAPLF